MTSRRLSWLGGIRWSGTIWLVPFGLATFGRHSHPNDSSIRYANQPSVQQQSRSNSPAAIVLRPGISLEAAITTLSRASRTPIGFESAEEPSRRTLALASPVNVARANARDVLPEILGREPWYVWTEIDGAFEIRPVGPDGVSQRTLLDRPVEDFSLADVTLPEALDAILKLYSPMGYRRGQGRLQSSSSPDMLRRFSLQARQTTVARLLTNIALAHGAAGWLVTYHAFDGNRGVVDPAIQLFTFDGWMVGQSLPPAATSPKR